MKQTQLKEVLDVPGEGWSGDTKTDEQIIKHFSLNTGWTNRSREIIIVLGQVTEEIQQG